MRTAVKKSIAWCRIAARTLAPCALAVCIGCTAGSDDDSDNGGQVSIAPVSRGPTSTYVTLTSAELSLALVELVPCTADAAILQTMNFPIELLYEPWPHVIFVSAVTDFCGVNLNLAPAPSAPDAPLPDLQQLTALFRGTRADGTNFEIHSTLTLNFEFLESGATLDAAHLVVGADLNRWFSDVDLDHADLTDDGVALVDVDHNPDVLTAFDAGAATAFALYVDANGDGALTDDELTPVATASMPTQ
jgi:hypothetical protein